MRTATHAREYEFAKSTRRWYPREGVYRRESRWGRSIGALMHAGPLGTDGSALALHPAALSTAAPGERTGDVSTAGYVCGASHHDSFPHCRIDFTIKQSG
ncbi:unnamed protein product [Lampetra planeri]